MSGISELVEQITREMDSMPWFVQYKTVFEAVNGDATLKNKVLRYKQMSVAYAEKRASGETADFNEEKAIGALYAEIMLAEDGCRLFELERRLFECLDEIYACADGSEFSKMQRTMLKWQP